VTLSSLLNLLSTYSIKGKEGNMYKFVIKSKQGSEYEGISGDYEVLQELVNKKISSANLKGQVEIYAGRKLIESYEI